MDTVVGTVVCTDVGMELWRPVLAALVAAKATHLAFDTAAVVLPVLAVVPALVVVLGVALLGPL